MTKDDLLMYSQITREIRQLRDEINRIFEATIGPKVRPMTGMPSSASGFVTSELERAVVEMTMLKEKYEAKCCELLKYQKAIEDAISGLPSRERTLIRYRYVDCYEWNKIGALMKYSYRSLHRIHNKALEMLSEIKVGTP